MKEYRFTIDGEQFTVNINSVEDSSAEVCVNGVPYKVGIEPKEQEETNTVSIARPVSVSQSNGIKITSPLPGVIVEISVSEGQAVRAGDKVAVLEAMKMENEITAPEDGVVSSVAVRKGDAVLEGDTLVIL